VQTFVTANERCRIHIATDEETVREHAWRGSFPCDRIEEVRAVIDPTSEFAAPSTPA
jgi:hypothetical protein